MRYLDGEEESFGRALLACSLGLRGFDDSQIDDANALQWVKTIRAALERNGFGSDDEKREFSKAVDQLAHYFNQENWGVEL
jgi:hypothetical protein